MLLAVAEEGAMHASGIGGTTSAASADLSGRTQPRRVLTSISPLDLPKRPIHWLPI